MVERLLLKKKSLLEVLGSMDMPLNGIQIDDIVDVVHAQGKALELNSIRTLRLNHTSNGTTRDMFVLHVK